MDIAQCLLVYRRDGIVKIPSSIDPLLPSSAEIQNLAGEVCDVHAPNVVVTTENICFTKGESKCVETRKVATRIENFVSSNRNWTNLCSTGGILSTIVGLVCCDNEIDGTTSDPWCLYKEKLNIKPAGSSGFAPHLDAPSLRVTGLCENFVTVMIAIDDMTIENGCLQVCRGNWNEANSVMCQEPCLGIDESISIDPDGAGRRGAICDIAVCKLAWDYVECISGDIFIFSGWLPHRSACNSTQLPRRAVFLTYNQSEDGELSQAYYQIMRDMRSSYLRQYIADRIPVVK